MRSCSSLLTLETAVDKSKLKSILSYSGFPMSCEPIVDGIRANAGRGAALDGGARAKAARQRVPHVVHQQAESRPSLAAHQRARADAPPVRRQHVDPVRRLRSRFGHRRLGRGVLGASTCSPEQLVKLSGIGCSSKTTAYFVSGSHGFNAVHGRMPSIASGANAANRGLTYVGISGDGDSLSIGIGQLVHAIRRNVNMLYLIENNGVYGLTKGQFSASADIGTKAKQGGENQMPRRRSIRCCWRLSLGATFVARSFSGDKAQLVPLIQAGMRHNGFALIDVLSPCVTFNDHEGSTKSYTFTREHYHAAIEADFVPPAGEISVDYPAGEAIPVSLHDGSRVVLRKLDRDLRSDRPYRRVRFYREQAQTRRVRDRAHPHRRSRRAPSFTTLNRIEQRRRSTASRSTSFLRAARRSKN